MPANDHPQYAAFPCKTFLVLSTKTSLACKMTVMSEQSNLYQQFKRERPQGHFLLWNTVLCCGLASLSNSVTLGITLSIPVSYHQKCLCARAFSFIGDCAPRFPTGAPSLDSAGDSRPPDPSPPYKKSCGARELTVYKQASDL